MDNIALAVVSTLVVVVGVAWSIAKWIAKKSIEIAQAKAKIEVLTQRLEVEKAKRETTMIREKVEDTDYLVKLWKSTISKIKAELRKTSKLLIEVTSDNIRLNKQLEDAEQTIQDMIVNQDPLSEIIAAEIEQHGDIY